MTDTAADLTALADRVAERASDVPGVMAVYPTAPLPWRMLPPGAPGHRPLVRLQQGDGGLEALLSVGIAEDAAAPAVGEAVRAAASAELAAAGHPRHVVTVRVATLG